MTGLDLIAGLVLASSLLAPKLAPKSEWAGEIYFIKKSATEFGRREADGTFTQVGYLGSIQYTVLAEEKDLAQVQNLGAKVWVRKADLVKVSEAPEYYTKMLDENPLEATQWFAFRAWAQFRNGRTPEALKDY